MGMLFIILGLAVHQIEAMLVRRYGKKYGVGGFIFNAVICVFATLYFLITDKDGLHFTKEILLYGALNSVMYALGFYAAYVAFRSGSFGLTRLFTSFGTILTVFYGVFFLGEPFSVVNCMALALLVLSIYLLNAERSAETKQKITAKWLISILLSVLANMFIMIIGKEFQTAVSKEYNNEFLMVSLGFASLFLLLLGLIFDRDKLRATLKYGLLYGAGAGVCNGINNLLILLTYNYLPVSFISPVRTGLGMVISFVVSVLLYKEKFSKQQIISVGIGVGAVILMNL